MRASDSSSENAFDGAQYGLIGAAPNFLAALEQLRCYSNSSAPLLILGETGTGKELAARAAHYLSSRRDYPFVPINCGALPENLIESEFFGHAKGSFTDAARARQGLLRHAHRGTLFLDEVEALPARAQIVLLRFLEDGIVRPVGNEQQHKVDVRVIAASNVDMGVLIAQHGYRADLKYRLDVLGVRLPPLRDRRGDIALLVPHLLADSPQELSTRPQPITASALALLEAHTWPGNVRELQHVLLRAQLRCRASKLDREDLMNACPDFLDRAPAARPLNRYWLRAEKQAALDRVERAFVQLALAQSQGNISKAARSCNMERAALSRLVKKHCVLLPPLDSPEHHQIEV